MTIQAVKTCSTNRATIPLPRVLPKDVRRKIEDAVERHIVARDALISFLDECDAETDDLEDVDDDTDVVDEPHDPEPDAENTYPEAHNGYPVGFVGDDLEPSLGWTIAGAHGATEDLEEDHERERTLGYPERINQVGLENSCMESAAR